MKRAFIVIRELAITGTNRRVYEVMPYAYWNEDAAKHYILKDRGLVIERKIASLGLKGIAYQIIPIQVTK